ncbi:MAG: LysM peptidoglycan-binding domain-containing protein [bacterium]|nr:LysM peptidoglycan-binding domain-containing protein [bacterium]
MVLFVLISLGSGSLSQSLSKERDFSLASVAETLASQKYQEFYLGQEKNFGPESPEFLLVSADSLQAATPPTTFSPQVLGALVGGAEFEDSRNVITEYLVEEGDSLWSISDEFDISLNTIFWANDLNKNSLIKPGQKLVILPVSGVIHHIKSGDTISGIAETYEAKARDIISFNRLSDEGDIFVGDIVIVPGGEMPVASSNYAPVWVPLADSYFICPISSPCRITQGLHWYNAVDFSHGNCGEPIYAAAGGVVQRVNLTNSTSRWAFGGAGNNVTVLHPNGAVTMYGHIAKSLVSPGQQVSQGQIIAQVGGQPGTAGAGLSTGCHLHFGVSGARNPFAY